MCIADIMSQCMTDWHDTLTWQHDMTIRQMFWQNDMKRMCVAKLVYKKYKRKKYETKCVFVGGAG